VNLAAVSCPAFQINGAGGIGMLAGKSFLHSKNLIYANIYKKVRYRHKNYVMVSRGAFQINAGRGIGK